MIWAVDPGINGAFAKFDLEEGMLEIFDMPIIEVKKKKQVSPQLVADILKNEHGHIYIEQVGAMPGQGVASMFNFGKSFGILLGCAAGLQMPTTLITPHQWQKGVKTVAGEDAHRHRACQLFPAYSQLFARKKDGGRAAAALIAYYAALFVESVDYDG